MKLNVIIPVFNEEDCLIDFYTEINKTLKNVDYTLTFINDGSTDKSLSILKEIYEGDKFNVKIISFSRNFGKDAAIYAGIKNSDAQYTAIIDADLQQQPKHLLEMLNKFDADQEIDSICMTQKQTKKRFFQKLFYKIINKISKIDFVEGASDFRMFKKSVVEKLVLLSESNRFSKGLFAWIGFNTLYLEYKPNKREKGKSKWNIFKLFNYAIDGFINFSIAPLKISIYFGIISSASAFIYFMSVVIKTLIFGKDVPGYASIVSLILLLGGIQLFCIGIIGEYLGKTYIETKRRPAYIEKERIGFDETLL